MSYDDGSGDWMNPPPPGTVEDQHGDPVKDRYLGPDRCDKDYRQFPRSPNKHGGENCTNLSSQHNVSSRSRTRSRSNDRYSKHFRDRRRRSRSRDYRKRRSRSRSTSHKRYDKRYSHKSYRRYSRSRSRSRSRRHRRSRSRSPRRGSHSRSWSTTSNSDNESYSSRRRLDVLKNQEYTRKVYSKHKKEIEEEEEEEEVVQENSFKNDGSFLEMFKKMQEQQALAAKAAAEDSTASASEPKKPVPIFGKRRGGRVLKTGMVQKIKNPNELDEEPKDAWSVYMKEVRKYKEACCDDDSKTRPLVK